MSRKDAEKDFTKQNGIFSFETKEKMPIKGLEKGDGVPPSPVAMAGQVGKEGKNLSLKGFSLFPKSDNQPF